MSETVKNVFLVSGLSGSGKDWILEQLKKQVEVGKITSFASRVPRNQQEIDDGIYYFLDNNTEINEKLNDCLQAFYSTNGDIYFSTTEEFKKQLNDFDNIYLVMTPPSIKKIVELLERNLPEFVINVFYFHIEVPEKIRVERMIQRNDDPEAINKRINIFDKEIMSSYRQLIDSKEYKENRCNLEMSCLVNKSEDVLTSILTMIKNNA